MGIYDRRNPEIDRILVVCVKPYLQYMEEMKTKYSFLKRIWITAGGATFQVSMLNGVRFLENKIEHEDIVVFHFSVSLFIIGNNISDVIQVCSEKGNSISTTDFLPLSGKKKTTESTSDPNNYSDEYINRDTVAVMNTPHAFRYGLICDLYKEAILFGIINSVDRTRLRLCMQRQENNRQSKPFKRGFNNG